MFARRISRALSSHHSALFRRLLSTVEGNPHIVSKPPSLLTPIDSSQFAFPDKRSLNGHILSLLPTDPPTLEIAIGTTSKFPPTPDSLTENPKFHTILQSVVAEYATEDPEVISKAAAMASESGANLFGHGRRSSARRQSGDAGGGASAQGGAGSGGRGGWIHVSDQRNPPDWGRVAWYGPHQQYLLQIWTCG